MRILITGGDHTGKDTLARALVEESRGELVYSRPSSRCFAELIPEWQDGRDLDEWWQHRRDHREEWIVAFDQLRRTSRPAVFATALYEQGESIVTGLRFTSELIDLLTSEWKPDVVIWCRYAKRHQEGPDALTLDLVMQLGSITFVPVLGVWSHTIAPQLWQLLRSVT